MVNEANKKNHDNRCKATQSLVDLPDSNDRNIYLRDVETEWGCGNQVGVSKEKMSQNQSPGDFSSHGSIMVDALAQVLVGRVISEPSELVLNSLGEMRILDDGVLSHLAREFRIEVGNV